MRRDLPSDGIDRLGGRTRTGLAAGLCLAWAGVAVTLLLAGASAAAQTTGTPSPRTQPPAPIWAVPQPTDPSAPTGQSSRQGLPESYSTGSGQTGGDAADGADWRRYLKGSGNAAIGSGTDSSGVGRTPSIDPQGTGLGGASGDAKRSIGIGGFYGEIGGNRVGSSPAGQSAALGAAGLGGGLRAGVQPITLEAPVDCTIGRDCVIASHVDRQPGVSAQDYRCGSLTEDGATLTVIRARDLPTMTRGLSVLASARGQVVAARDGAPDTAPTRRSALARFNPNPGNHVIVDHGGGWQTEYHNLKSGSVSVRPGQTVAAGQAIGQIGLSGDAALPQLGFKVTLDGRPIDPFIGLDAPAPCGTPPRNGLWSHTAVGAMKYIPSAVLTAGFADSAPRHASTLPVIETRAPETPRSPILFWVLVHGLQTGDREQIELIGPGGESLGRARFIFPRDKDSWVSLIAMNPPDGGWPEGTYVGRYRLFRVDGDSRMRMQQILNHEEPIRIR